MRTDELIQELAGSGGTPTRLLAPRLCAALAVTTVTTIAVVAAFGLRPDLGHALLSAGGFLKVALPVVIAVATVPVALACCRPEVRVRRWPLALLISGLFAGLAYDLLTGSAAGRAGGWTMANQVQCIARVGALSLAPLAAVFWALREGAPTRPAAAGAVAGLMSGSLAAAAYALHCANDALPFVAASYGAAIGLVALAGAGLGARLMRW